MRVWNTDGMKQINHIMKKLSAGKFWWSFYTVPVQSHSVYLSLRSSQICVPTWSAWNEVYSIFKVFTIKRYRIQTNAVGNLNWRTYTLKNIWWNFTRSWWKFHQIPIVPCTLHILVNCTRKSWWTNFNNDPGEYYQETMVNIPGYFWPKSWWNLPVFPG